MKAATPLRALGQLERIQSEYGPGLAARKLALLRELARVRFASARAVERYHECLGWLRAYSDDARVAAEAERQSAGFARRADLRRFRAALESSGIAGTDVRYPFFADTARWLAARFPARLEVDWEAFDEDHRTLLEERIGLATHPAESPLVDEGALDARGWVQALRGRGEADGAALAKCLAGLGGDGLTRDFYQDELDVPMVLRWGPGGPARSTARARGAPIVHQSGPLRRGRPDLRAELVRPPLAIRAVSLAEGRTLVALAREAMVTRARDLDAFSYGDPRDVRMVDCGDGLAFAAIGMLPERRLLLESVYGFLTLKNGVPIGYVLTSAINGSSEIAYNVFETYRGGEAAWVYARVLAMTRALFGSEVFTIYPYQLGGGGNQEGLDSGSWWFYQKLGFRARDRGVLRVMRRELARMQRKPGYRTPVRVLAEIAEHNVYLEDDSSRQDVIGALRADRIGMAATRLLSRRWGGDRRAAATAAADAAAALLGAGARGRWPAAERASFAAWSPLILALPEAARWSAAQKRAAVAVMRAKGGRRESDFVRLLDRHAALRAGLERLAARPAAGLD
jgi:hypothetical protein